MLQQTTVPTVIPYFENFLGRWPTVEALAKADLDDILHAWQGLGYYARARNLHKCAQVVATEYAGQFPNSETQLLKLPGIGPYTTAAIAAIAYDLPTVPVDGTSIIPPSKPLGGRLRIQISPLEFSNQNATPWRVGLVFLGGLTG